MNVLLVLAHPRTDSLCNAVAAAFEEGLVSGGHVPERADLMAEGFDPVLRRPDEPDWANADKRYSEAVLSEMARIERNAATVMIYPVWWWSMPAILKGWIDRVWNNGWAYGERTYPHHTVLSLGLAGGSAASYARAGYDIAMKTQIETGILRYCGVSRARHAMLFDTLDGRPTTDLIVAEARSMGLAFPLSHLGKS